MSDYSALLARVEAPEGSGREIHDAATGEVIGRAPEHTAADLDAAIASAKKAQPAWNALGHEKRSALLLEIADRIDAGILTVTVEPGGDSAEALARSRTLAFMERVRAAEARAAVDGVLLDSRGAWQRYLE